MIVLVVLILLSAFFSGTETALMSVNRYRLKHLAREGHAGARIADRLLQQPDRLIVMILIGNNLVNFSASALVTLIAHQLGGAAVAIGVALFTFVIIIFAEVTPKTLAALYPERVALRAAHIYQPLQRLFFPLVWLINRVARLLLRLMGLKEAADDDALSSEELRTVVTEAGHLLPRRRRRMLLRVLDLEKVVVEDIMVPRGEVIGIDINDDWTQILDTIQHSRHTRLPVFEDNLDHCLGILHLRRVAHPLAEGLLDHHRLTSLLYEPYFVPEGTPLNRQLIHFQTDHKRFAIVVDEYGDTQGIVTLEDVLEEIVGEFTNAQLNPAKDLIRQSDGSFLVNASINLRDLNRYMNWKLPTDSAKTLNGLVIETLETIPKV
ncbi:MAG: HlyC/CorC family transporter, partial [Gammaproteobacteria bacterium]|nr:HlyC/CorC family transporter [Gammaproteobacteria bacterium]